MKFSLPNINTVRKGGKLYRYNRLTGVRILGEPGTPQFLESYLEAEKAEPATTVAGSFSSLIQKYEQGAEFRKLASGTKANYRKSMLALRVRYGACPLKAMEKKAIRGEFAEWRDEIIRAGKPGQARNLMVFAQTLFQWGEDRNLLDVNRLRKMKQVYKVNRSEMTWEPEQIKAVLKVARPDVARAAHMALWSAQRQGDICGLSWPDIQKDALTVRQNKTGAFVGLPLVGGFKDFVLSQPRLSDFILMNSKGGKWQEVSLRQAWRKAVADAGLTETGLRFHDLRGTTITALADMGASEAQIAAISGHAYAGQVPTLKAYLRKTHTQARAAMELLNQSWIGELAN